MLPDYSRCCLIGDDNSMPVHSERREQIADAALEVLAAEGAHGLTHRAVDARTGLPAGTTSNFFNSRQALFLGAGRRLADRHWRYVQSLREEIDGPLDRKGLATILTNVVSAKGEFRMLQLARYELFLAGVRDPSLHADLMRLRNASLEIAATLLQAAGLPDPDRRVQLLSSLLNGLVFDQLTASNTALIDPETVEEIITVYLGPPSATVREQED